MPILMDTFELDRCRDVSDRGSHEFADTECCRPPPPQKFPLREADGQTSRCMDHAYVVRYKRLSCRAMGAMIAVEEPARWTFSNQE
jgi:hypothetical protein